MLTSEDSLYRRVNFWPEYLSTRITWVISSVLEQLSGKSLEGFLFLEMTPITIAAALKPQTLRAVQSETKALI